MSLKERTINVDIMTKEYTKLKYKQGDSNQTLKFKFYKNGSELDLTGYVAGIFYEKPNNEILEKTGNISKNTVTTTITSGVLNTAGVVKTEIFLTKGDEVSISFTIVIEVESSINKNAAVQEKEEWDVIKDLLNNGNNVSLIDDSLTTTNKTWSSSKIDSQIKEIAKDLLLEDGKLYLKKSDGTKLGTGVVLPVSGSGGSITWEKVTDKPTTFTPSAHSHSKSDITDFPTIPTVSNDLTNALKANYDSAYTHSTSAHAPSTAQKNSDITKEEIEAKLIGEISTHSHSGYLPTGGIAGQVLSKIDGTDYNTQWIDVVSGGGRVEWTEVYNDTTTLTEGVTAITMTTRQDITQFTKFFVYMEISKNTNSEASGNTTITQFNLSNYKFGYYSLGELTSSTGNNIMGRITFEEPMISMQFVKNRNALPHNGSQVIWMPTFSTSTVVRNNNISILFDKAYIGSVKLKLWAI